MIPPIVSSKWLHENLSNSDLILLDASDMDNKAGLTSEFINQKIKGARYFDLKNTFSDPDGVYPNTFPGEEHFTSGCRSLGVNNSSRIVVYDNLGIYSSPRVWWMFKAMGHEKVHVLNGGLPDWVRHGFETVTYYNIENGIGDFKPRLQSTCIKDIDFIQSNISDQHYLLIDARAEGRFNGTAKEPREGLRSGSIPGSINIPYSSLLANGMFKSENELLQIFRSRGVDDRPLVFSCGSGVTACIALLASEMILDNVTSVYDGSWTEWASLNP